jgi:DNA-binding MarR family transcriptional regulator
MKPAQNLQLEFDIDPIIHEPARLKIITFLSLVESADFTFLISRTGLTMGNFSTHMTKLQKAGYIDVKKSIKDNRSHTLLSLTDSGKKAYSNYRKVMQGILGL